MTAQEIQQEALTRATCGKTMSNYPAIINGFMAKGIPAEQIEPRVNCLTFHAWKALGRKVRKGEHGVKVTTFVPVADKTRTTTDPQTGEVSVRQATRPWFTTVFHVSQTDQV
jgi:antirestriction protein ArdC